MEKETGIRELHDQGSNDTSREDPDLSWAGDVLGSLYEPEDAAADPGFISEISQHIRTGPDRGTVLKPSGGLSFRTRFKVAASATAGMLVLTAGLAFAGALPDAAQDKASEMLAKLGVSIPAGSAPGHATDEDADADRNGKGSEIRSTIEGTEPGLERGSSVSDKASDGKSRAGENGGPDSARETGPPAEPPGKSNTNRP